MYNSPDRWPVSCCKQRASSSSPTTVTGADLAVFAAGGELAESVEHQPMPAELGFLSQIAAHGQRSVHRIRAQANIAQRSRLAPTLRGDRAHRPGLKYEYSLRVRLPAQLAL